MMRIPLRPEQFGDKERCLLETGAIRVSGFQYDSGVQAVRIVSDRVELICLPFFGQQIWRARVDGRDLTMASMFETPRQTTEYLETYGAFFLHCGLTGLGAPGPDDAHRLHAELPLAGYDEAWLEVSGDALSLSGRYQHSVAFSTNYLATPKVTVKPGQGLFDVSLEVENLRQAPLEVMYLAHANFRPVDHGRLVYAAKYAPEHVRVRQSIPSHISPPPGYADFIGELAKDPARHHVLGPDLGFDPEVVFALDMLAGEDGWSHGMQMHPGGHADVISHRPDQAPMAGRWISRTGDQQGLGIVFPATAGVEGRAAELAKGAYHLLPGREHWVVEMRMGALGADDARALEARIDDIAGR